MDYNPQVRFNMTRFQFFFNICVCVWKPSLAFRWKKLHGMRSVSQIPLGMKGSLRPAVGYTKIMMIIIIVTIIYFNNTVGTNNAEITFQLRTKDKNWGIVCLNYDDDNEDEYNYYNVYSNYHSRLTILLVTEFPYDHRISYSTK